MVELTCSEKNSILYLHSHPKGPKKTVEEISEFLSLNEDIVKTICSDESVQFDEQALPTFDAENEQEDDNQDSSSWSSEGMDSYEILDCHCDQNENNKLLDAEHSSKRAAAINFLVDRFPYLKTYIGGRPNYYLEQMNRLKMKDVLVAFVAVMLLAIFADRAIREQAQRSKDNDIFREKWIRVCKIDFYDFLELDLSITRADAEFLQDLVNKLYSVDHFSDEKHNDLLRAVQHQKRVKNNLAGIMREVKLNWDHYKIPEYNMVQSIRSLALKLEDLLPVNDNSANTSNGQN